MNDKIQVQRKVYIPPNESGNYFIEHLWRASHDVLIWSTVQTSEVWEPVYYDEIIDDYRSEVINE